MVRKSILTYSYSERRRVVKDFCFPCGVPVDPAKSFEDIEKTLRVDYKIQRNRTFTFSLNGIQGDKFSEVFCLCYLVPDFIVL